MTGVRLEYKLGDGPLQRHMAALANLPTRDLMIELSEYMMDRVHENFANETNPDGTAWEPSQRVKESGGKTLQDTNTLHDAYVTNILSDTSFEIGAGGPAAAYVAIHHFGGKTNAHIIEAKNAKALKTPYGLYKRVNHPGSEIPMRRVLDITSEDEAEFDRISAAFIAERTGVAA